MGKVHFSFWLTAKNTFLHKNNRISVCLSVFLCVLKDLAYRWTDMVLLYNVVSTGQVYSDWRRATQPSHEKWEFFKKFFKTKIKFGAGSILFFPSPLPLPLSHKNDTKFIAASINIYIYGHLLVKCTSSIPKNLKHYVGEKRKWRVYIKLYKKVDFKIEGIGFNIL